MLIDYAKMIKRAHEMIFVNEAFMLKEGICPKPCRPSGALMAPPAGQLVGLQISFF